MDTNIDRRKVHRAESGILQGAKKKKKKSHIEQIFTFMQVLVSDQV